MRQFCLDETDKMALFRLFSDSRVTRYYNITTFTEPEQAWRMLQRRYERFWQRRGIRWAVTLKGNRDLIGSCGFNSLNQKVSAGELGYELARPFWNQGIMTEAVIAAAGYGFSKMGLARMEAWIVPENRASANLLLKVGFQSEGVVEGKGYWNGRFHDLELFSLLAEQWQP